MSQILDVYSHLLDHGGVEATNPQERSMTTTYQAKRQRANSVPGGYRSATASNIQQHFSSARTSASSVRNSEDGADDLHNRSRSIIRSEEPVQPPPIPHWQRELAVSRVGRQSRASSIFSTRTRLTVQSDDARSIDIEAGGQSYHINRDGSTITNTTAPPPYPGPPLDQLEEVSDEEGSLTRESTETLRKPSSETEARDSKRLRSIPIRTHLPTATSDTDLRPEPSRRTTPFELPQRFRQVLNMSWYGTPTQAENSNVNSSATSAKTLRRTQSESSSLANFKSLSAGSQNHSGRPHSDNGYDADGDNDDDDLAPARNIYPSTSGSTSLDASDERIAEISAHYTGMIRTMDRQHRQRLHDRDALLARLRELLNEKDIVYRQQLRDRDHTIDGLNSQLRHRDIMINEVKTRAYEIEEEMEMRIEKAKNEVEDMWEERWKDYEKLLREKLGGGSGPHETSSDVNDQNGGKGKTALYRGRDHVRSF